MNWSMKNSPDLWQEIGSPASPSKETLRRVKPVHEFDFYRGKFFGGGYFLRLVVDSEPPAELVLPKLNNNIDVSLGVAPEGRFEFTVALKNQEYQAQFQTLCTDLISSTRFIKREKEIEALQAVVMCICKWQKLLMRAHCGMLSEIQQLGLFGELVLLKDFFLVHTDTFSALSAWRGQSGAEQDFQFEQWLFEVKSQMASSDKIIHVSSEHQLDLVSGNIVLFHQLFSDSDQHGSGCTLKQLVEDIQQQLFEASAEAVDLFQARLQEAGYEHVDEYDSRHLLLTDRKAYEVTENFPHISASELKPGIGSVGYNIALKECLNFQIEMEKLPRKAFNDK